MSRKKLQLASMPSWTARFLTSDNPAQKWHSKEAKPHDESVAVWCESFLRERVAEKVLQGVKHICTTNNPVMCHGLADMKIVFGGAMRTPNAVSLSVCLLACLLACLSSS